MQNGSESFEFVMDFTEINNVQVSLFFDHRDGRELPLKKSYAVVQCQRPWSTYGHGIFPHRSTVP